MLINACAISRVHYSLVPKPVTVVIGLGTRLDVPKRTRLENGVLRNGQQPGSAVNSMLMLVDGHVHC